MDYLNEYTKICCNTYSYQEYVKELGQLKETIRDTNYFISILIDGDIARNNAQFEECKKHYQKAYDLDHTNYVCNCKMIEILDFLELRNLQKSTYFEVIENLKDPFSILAKMEIYLNNDDFHNYTIEYVRYKQLENVDPRLQAYNEAKYYAIKGENKKRFSILKTLYENNEFNSNVTNDLAYSLYLEKKYESAIEILEDGLTFDKYNYKIHNNLIVIYYFLEDKNNTLKHLQYCFSVFPNSYFLNYYSFIYESNINKNYPKALEAMCIVENMKKEAGEMTDKVFLYLNMKEFDKAIALAGEIIEGYPEDKRGYRCLAYCQYFMKKDIEEIFHNAAKAVKYSTSSINEEHSFDIYARNTYLELQIELAKDKDLIIDNIISDYQTYKSLGFVYAFRKYIEEFDIKELLNIAKKYIAKDKNNVEFFKYLVFVLRNKYQIYESTKLLNFLLYQENEANLFFSIAQQYFDYNDKISAVRVLKQGRKFYKTTDEIINFAKMLSNCGYPMTATNYLKLFMENNKSTLNTKNMNLIINARHYLFQFFKDRKRETKLDKILFESTLIQEQVQLKENEFTSFLSRKSQTNNDIIFHSLRKWNSYTPILSTSGTDSVGGGFYINIKGKGIVIDPGLNFVENFKKAGYSFGDIDTILVSHAHNDHTADIESILTLLYKYNSNIKKLYEMIEDQHDQKDLKELKSYDGLKKVENTFNKLIEYRPEPEQSKKNLEKYTKILNFYMTKSTFKKYGGIFKLQKSSNYRIHIIEGEKEYSICEESKDLGLYVFDNEHKEIISDYSSVGFVLKLKHYNLVYTGDTKISENVLQSIKSAIKKTKLSAKKKQIFLCNIGGLKQYEVEYNLDKYKNVYKNHLGRIGIYKLIKEFKPKLCLISEFGEEFEMQRLAITEVFDRNFSDTFFFPCEIGLKLRINEELHLQTYYISSIIKDVPEYSEKYLELSTVKYIDDVKGNIYFVNEEILQNYLSDFKRFKSLENNDSVNLIY